MQTYMTHAYTQRYMHAACITNINTIIGIDKRPGRQPYIHIYIKTDRHTGTQH